MYGEPGFFYEFMVWNLLPTLVEALIVSAAIYFGISFGIRKLSLPSQKGSGTQGASEIVRERYARGEISRPEYEQMREDLSPEERTSTQVDADYQRAQ